MEQREHMTKDLVTLPLKNTLWVDPNHSYYSRVSNGHMSNGP